MCMYVYKEHMKFTDALSEILELIWDSKNALENCSY